MAEIHFHFPEGQEISDMPINEVINIYNWQRFHLKRVNFISSMLLGRSDRHAIYHRFHREKTSELCVRRTNLLGLKINYWVKPGMT